MSTIDIRNNQSDDITSITFSDTNYGYASRIRKQGEYISLVDIDTDKEADVKGADIDNLILALRKAQELGWGK